MTGAWVHKHQHRYTAFDGRLYLERRPTLSAKWTARCCHGGRQLYKTTGTAVLADAQVAAERWYLDLLYRVRHGEPAGVHTLRAAWKAFITYHESQLLPAGTSNVKKIRRYRHTWSMVGEHLGSLPVTEITTTRLEAFRATRQQQRIDAKLPPLTEKTLHSDLGLVRLILKHAMRQGHLRFLPAFPVEHIQHASPDWFTPQEWLRLIETSEQRQIEAEEDAREGRNNAAAHIYAERRELHAFLFLMAHGCIRVDECLHLRWCDVDENARNPHLPFKHRTAILHIRVSKTGGRTGLGVGHFMTGLKILRALHPRAEPTDKLIRTPHRHGMKALLEEANLRVDSKGRTRNAKTLRHTSIMFRFLQNPDLRVHELTAIAGTSATVLEKYYLRHVTAQMVQDSMTKRALLEAGSTHKGSTATRKGARGFRQGFRSTKL